MVMVRNTYSKTYVSGGLAVTAAILTALAAVPLSQSTASAANSTTLSVTAEEMLTVKVGVPTEWATGESTSDGTFLRNIVTLDVTTNNTNGFTASLATADNTTNLVNSTNSNYYIPTLGGTTPKSSFPNNAWGYSVNDTNAGSDSSTYRPIAAKDGTPAYVANSAYTGSTVSKNIYFAAKANTAKASGTYSNNVVINVVSGVNTDGSGTTENPTIPQPSQNPTTPTTDPDTTDEFATYNPTTGTTAYTRTGSSSYTVGTTTVDTTTTGTTVTSGNKTSSTYANPAGVKTTSTPAAINEGTPLATGLAVTAGVAAVTGIVFFIIAKRRREDEEEEEY